MSTTDFLPRLGCELLCGAVIGAEHYSRSFPRFRRWRAMNWKAKLAGIRPTPSSRRCAPTRNVWARVKQLANRLRLENKAAGMIWQLLSQAKTD